MNRNPARHPSPPDLNRRLLGSFGMFLGMIVTLIVSAFLIVAFVFFGKMERLKGEEQALHREAIHSAGSIHTAVSSFKLDELFRASSKEKNRLERVLRKNGGVAYLRVLTTPPREAHVASAYREGFDPARAPEPPSLEGLGPARSSLRVRPAPFSSCEHSSGITELRVVLYSGYGLSLRPTGVLLIGVSTGDDCTSPTHRNLAENRMVREVLTAYLGDKPEFETENGASPSQERPFGVKLPNQSTIASHSDLLRESSRYYSRLARGADSVECFKLFDQELLPLAGSSDRDDPCQIDRLDILALSDDGRPPNKTVVKQSPNGPKSAEPGLRKSSQYLMMTPVFVDGELRGTLAFKLRGQTSIYSNLRSLFDTFVWTMLGIVAVLTIFMIAISAFYVLALRRRVAGPLDELVRIGEKFATGDKTDPVHHENATGLMNTDFYASELQDLAGTYARMVDQIQQSLKERDTAYDDLKATQQKLISSERQAVLGTVSGGVAHEIKNALNPVRLRSELLLEGVRTGRPVDIQEGLELIIRNVKRCTELSNRLSSFAKPSDIASRHDYDINTVIRDALMISKDLLDNEKIEAVADLGDVPSLKGLPKEIQQAVINFILNARDAIVDARKADGGLGGRITISTRHTDDIVEMKISDDGCGMDEDTRVRVFEPFFTTKEAGRGTGLGMSISLSILAAHRADVAVESTPGAGTTLTVRFRCGEEIDV